MKKSKCFLLTVLFSILTLLVTCWSAYDWRSHAVYWVVSLGYFLMTYVCLEKFSKKVANLNPWMIVTAVIVGLLIMHVPRYIYSPFHSVSGYLMVIASSLIATALAGFCFETKKTFAFVVSYIIFCLFNMLMPDFWTGLWQKGII